MDLINSSYPYCPSKALLILVREAQSQNTQLATPKTTPKKETTATLQNKSICANIIIQHSQSLCLSQSVCDKAIQLSRQAFDVCARPTLRLNFRKCTSGNGIPSLTAASCMLIALKLEGVNGSVGGNGFKELSRCFCISRRELFKGFKDVMRVLGIQGDVMKTVYKQ